MSEATRAAAAAVLGVVDVPGSLFPTVGRVLRLTVARDDNGYVTGIYGLAVDIDGDMYLCKYGGGFAAEISTSSDGSFVGRDVKVEKVGRALVVAYTVNGSDQ